MSGGVHETPQKFKKLMQTEIPIEPQHYTLHFYGNLQIYLKRLMQNHLIMLLNMFRIHSLTNPTCLIQISKISPHVWIVHDALFVTLQLCMIKIIIASEKVIISFSLSEGKEAHKSKPLKCLNITNLQHYDQSLKI